VYVHPGNFYEIPYTPYLQLLVLKWDKTSGQVFYGIIGKNSKIGMISHFWKINKIFFVFDKLVTDGK